MGLEYGFGLYATDPRPTENQFQDLSEVQKSVYHQFLPFMLMFVDIGHIHEKTILHITKRLEHCFADTFKELKLAADEQHITPEKYLEPFIGFRANVITLSRAEFLKKHARRLRAGIPDLKDDEIWKLRNENVSVTVIKQLATEP